MKGTLWIFLIFLLSCSSPISRSPSSASFDCTQPIEIFAREQENLNYQKMQEYLEQRRIDKFQSQREDHEIDLEELILNDKKYSVIGILGKSSSMVYLAKDKTGKFVTIKMSMHSDDTWLDITWEYEKYASKFFKAKGLPIVQVLDVGIVNGRYVLVKEYRAGLSYAEVQELNWVLPGNFIQKIIQQDLWNMRSSFIEANDSLGQWLRSEGINLLRNKSAEQQILINNMINKGDLGDHNFLFDPQAREWFCIDP